MAGIYESDQPLKVQELGNTIHIAQSDKVPFGRLLKRGKKPNQMLAEWPAQNYPRRGFGGTMDGNDISQFSHVGRSSISGYGMWMRTEGWMVSKLATLTNAAGVGFKEKAHQATQDALVLAQMMERQLLSDVDTRAENKGTNVPYRSRGAFSWLSPTAQAVLPVPAEFRPAAASKYSGALADFKPTSMEDMLEAAALQKREAVDLTGFVGLELKGQMSKWPQLNQDASATDKATQVYNVDAKEKRFLQVVNFFEFDAGMVKTLPSFYLLCNEADGEPTAYSNKSGIFVDLSMWELAYFQEPTSWEEPPKSGGPRGYHDTVYIAKCLNGMGQAMAYINS